MIEVITYITKGEPSILKNPLLRTLQLKVLFVEKSYDEDL